MVFNNRAKKDSGPRTNEQITASEVRVISSTGKQIFNLSFKVRLKQNVRLPPVVACYMVHNSKVALATAKGSVFEVQRLDFENQTGRT